MRHFLAAYRASMVERSQQLHGLHSVTSGGAGAQHTSCAAGGAAGRQAHAPAGAAAGLLPCSSALDLPAPSVIVSDAVGSKAGAGVGSLRASNPAADVEAPAVLGAASDEDPVQAALTRACSRHRLGSLTASNLPPGKVSGRWSGRWDSMRRRSSTVPRVATAGTAAAAHQVGPASPAAAAADDTAGASKDVEGLVPAGKDQVLRQVMFTGLAAKRWKQAAVSAGASRQRSKLSDVEERQEGQEDQDDWEGDGLSPFQSLQLSRKLDDLDDDTVEVPLHVKVRCCWAAAVDVWPYLTAAFLMPVINGQLAPLASQRDYNTVAYGHWWNGLYFTQILAFSSVTGGFLGSLFVNEYKRKLHMLAMAAGMLAFLPAFAVSIYMEGGPVGKVILLFFLNAYSGYVHSCAKKTCRERSHAEERWVQMVLSLVSAASFFCGNCISWMWLRIKV